MLPRSDYRIDDDWKTCSLRGTGSSTIVVDSSFVPSHRMVDPALVIMGKGPGRERNPSPLFGLPFAAALAWYLGANALGAATQVVRDFADKSSTKRSTFTGQSVVSEPLLVHIGSASAAVEAAGAIMRYRAAAIDAKLDSGEALSRHEVLASSRDLAFAVRLCVDATDESMRFSGASGLLLSSPVQQGWRDVHGVSAHMGFNTDTTYALCGRSMLGLPMPPGFF
jgi:3-hydroxy-9,10-secoandrosta-1,3,5(10)-triene-9,17-dione monooxygenase